MSEHPINQPRTPAKVGMVSLGCTKNQVDAEHMLALLRQGGYALCADAKECDVVIVNTCGFIEDAKKESIETILEFAGLKGTGHLKVLVVTGCLAERYQQEMAAEIPEADVILGIGSNHAIVQAIDRALSGEQVRSFGAKEQLSLTGDRVLTTPGYSAYLKVADGCDNRCTYCAIPLIRGSFRSRPLEDVLAEAEHLVADGVRELNLIAQDTTRYGEDLGGNLLLPTLLERLCALEGLRWVRILYCYPDRVTDDLLRVMAQQPKVVPYLDLPLQHASGRILSAMNRRFDRASLTALIAHIREMVPGITLRTTLIAGFPGETEDDFAELCGFVEEIGFDRLGCFAYSAEEDTPAALMDDQLDEETKRRRAEIVMELQMGIAEECNRQKRGQTLEVLVEGYNARQRLYEGRSAADAPDIDGRVYFSSKHTLRPGDFVDVLIDDVDGYDLVGHALQGGDET